MTSIFTTCEKNKEMRITDGLRARDPYPSPDNKKLIFVVNKLGRNRLASLDIAAAKDHAVREADVTWLSEETADQYETPRYSPDGTLIVTGVWQPGGYKDIWVLDERGNKIEELMHDRAIDGNATWSPDGKVIYFSSDRTGIFNLYAYRTRNKEDLPDNECTGRRVLACALTGRENARVLVLQLRRIRHSPAACGLRVLEIGGTLPGPVSCGHLCRETG